MQHLRVKTPDRESLSEVKRANEIQVGFNARARARAIVGLRVVDL